MIVALPRNLPAARLLREEGVSVLEGSNAALFMLRPIRIALLNLMPDKPVTELQFARLLGHVPQAVELTLIRPGIHHSRTTSPVHLNRYYRTWEDVAHCTFDGLIVTGAPVENLDFEAVDYWSELQAIFDWAEHSVVRSLFICWAAQAALYHRFGVGKTALERKAFGVFEQTICRRDRALMNGLGACIATPVSRHTEVPIGDVDRHPALDVLAVSDDTGLCMVEDRHRGALMMFNHLEYDTATLDAEYRRDRGCGHNIDVPANYYPQDDPNRRPLNEWAATARRFFSNWVTEIAHARRCDAEYRGNRTGLAALAR